MVLLYTKIFLAIRKRAAKMTKQKKRQMQPTPGVGTMNQKIEAHTPTAAESLSTTTVRPTIGKVFQPITEPNLCQAGLHTSSDVPIVVRGEPVEQVSSELRHILNSNASHSTTIRDEAEEGAQVELITQGSNVGNEKDTDVSVNPHIDWPSVVIDSDKVEDCVGRRLAAGTTGRKSSVPGGGIQTNEIATTTKFRFQFPKKHPKSNKSNNKKEKSATKRERKATKTLAIVLGNLYRLSLLSILWLECTKKGLLGSLFSQIFSGTRLNV